jgi:fumarate hydratase subunit beta
MLECVKIYSPFDNAVVEKLKFGTMVLVSGVVYTARDAAHKKMVQALEEGKELPFEIEGQTIYYMGPSPAPPDRIIGSAGPTTSSRMDIYTLPLLAAGLKAMIGKGDRSLKVREAIKQHKAVYLVTIGGAGALLSKRIRKAEIISYPELAVEAMMRLEVEDFPAIVANDAYGGDLFTANRANYKREVV